VLASPTWAWLMTPMIWAANQLDRGFIPNDMLATIDAEVGFDVTAQLGQIRAPSLLIAGGRDRAFPLPLVEATVAGIPNCRLIVYPHAGHLGTMMNRHFGRDVAAFLSMPLPGPA
jgi:pimeloyl-ACP methyl ester carboxylesterase